MKMFKKIAFLLCLLMNYSMAADNFKHGIAIFGDLAYKKGFSKFDYASFAAKKGGEVVLGVQGSFDSLNPFILKGLAAEGTDYLYDSLLQNSADEISASYGLLAKGVKFVDNGYSLVFLLDKRAKFHDGRAVLADDVVFSFDILRQKGHPSYKIALRDVKKVVSLSKRVVKFSFSTNKNKDLAFLIGSVKILPRHFYKNRDFEKTSLEKPLGSGPYMVENVDAGKSVTYVLNENYWARNLNVNVGRYNFKRIKYDYYLDANVMLEAFKAGEFDFRQENVARNWANAYNIEAIARGDLLKKQIKHDLPAPIQAFVPNLRRAKFQDLALRKALNYAFNFDWLKKHIFYGSYQRTQSYFANSQFAYTDFSLPEGEKDGFGRKNLVAAKKILDEEGYFVKNGVLHDKNGREIEIEFLLVSKAFEMIAAPFIDNLKKLGIKAKMKFVEQNQYQLRLRNFDYDVMVAVFGQGLVPGSELLRYWHSSQAGISGSQNYSGLRDEKVDFLVEKIAKTSSKRQLQRLCRELDRYLLKNYFTILQWYSDSYRILYKKELKKPKISPKYGIGFDFWWRVET